MKMVIKSLCVTLGILAAMGACGGTSTIGSGKEGSGQDPLQSVDPNCSGSQADAIPACDNPYGPFAYGQYCVNDPIRPGGKNCPGFGILEQGSTCTLMSGVCTIDCTTDAQCPAPGSGTSHAVCGQVAPDADPLICVLPCDSGQTCPDGMACKHVENGRWMCMFEMPCLRPLPADWGQTRPSYPCVAGET